MRVGPPIWSLGTSLVTEWEKHSESFSSQLKTSTAFIKRLPFTFLIHALFIVLMASALHWMRRRIRKLAEEKPGPAARFADPRSPRVESRKSRPLDPFSFPNVRFFPLFRVPEYSELSVNPASWSR